jgi:hypothetical protein
MDARLSEFQVTLFMLWIQITDLSPFIPQIYYWVLRDKYGLFSNMGEAVATGERRAAEVL